MASSRGMPVAVVTHEYNKLPQDEMGWQRAPRGAWGLTLGVLSSKPARREREGIEFGAFQSSGWLYPLQSLKFPTKTFWKDGRCMDLCVMLILSCPGRIEAHYRVRMLELASGNFLRVM